MSTIHEYLRITMGFNNTISRAIRYIYELQLFAYQSSPVFYQQLYEVEAQLTRLSLFVKQKGGPNIYH